MKKKSSFRLITLLSFCLLNQPFFSQIQNGGFENWTNMGAYENPSNWQHLNDYTAELFTYTCTKGTPGNPGNSFLKLTSKNVPNAITFPGIAVYGTLDFASFQAVKGLPFTERPEKLTGAWQYMVFGSGQGFIDVRLTRWDAGTNSRVVVASKLQSLPGMVMSWADFEIPLEYFDDANPDSCMIVLSASGSTPTNNDYLWVDDLQFEGTVGVNELGTTYAPLNMFPNPASGNLSLMSTKFNHENVQCVVTNQMGEVVFSQLVRIEQHQVNLTLPELTSGNYLLQLVGNREKEIGKLVIQH